MTSTMSQAQQTARHSDEFRRKFGILDNAAIGVIQVRTREPFRAVKVLKAFAFSSSKVFKMHTVLRGWDTYDRSQPDVAPASDNAVDYLAGLKALDLDNAPRNGIFVMMYPHKPLAMGNMALIQILKEYVQKFQLDQRRLVLITPPSFSMPEELTDDILILDFDAPSYAELREAFGRVLSDLPESKRPVYNAEAVDQIIAGGAGMTLHEFENAVSRALITETEILPRMPVAKMCDHLLSIKTEVVKRSEVLEIMEATPIDQIGGLENLKDWILKRSNCFSQDARDFGVEPPKGIALIGPPGTGKSLSAKATAAVMNLPLIRFDVSRIFNSLVGQSEARVREALKMVDSMAPCVLMIDEVDKAFQRTGGGDSGVGMRVLGAILTWMQESKSGAFVVATANRTDNLPSEFLRRGRLDEVFSVTVPNEVERAEIIKIHLRKRRQPVDQIDVSIAVARSEGYVAAEIEAAVKDAVIEAFTLGVAVTGQLVADQFANMVPLSEAFAEDFSAMADWASKNARPASVAPGEQVGQGTPGRARVRLRTTPGKSPGAVDGRRAMNLDG